jgi:hypothetical protein
MGRENGAGGGTEEEVAEKGKKKKIIKHTSPQVFMNGLWVRIPEGFFFLARLRNPYSRIFDSFD